MTSSTKRKGVPDAETCGMSNRSDTRLARGAIKKMGYLTPAQRDLLLKIVDHWVAWRYRTGVIYPGRAKLAKQCLCSPRTVSDALARFRELGFIEVHKFPRGGLHRATHYVVHLDVISRCRTVSEVDGKLQLVQPAQKLTANEESNA